MSKSKNKPQAESKPLQKRSQQLYDSILQAALKSYDELGFEKSTTNKIAEIAGVSIGSLYRYFPDKNYIYKKTLDAFVTKNRNFFISALADCPRDSIPKTSEILLSDVVDYFLTRKNFFTVLTSRMIETSSTDLLFEARNKLAYEMSHIFVEQYPDLQNVDKADLQAQLYQGFQTFVPALQAVIFQGADTERIQRFKKNMSIFFVGLIESSKRIDISSR